MIELLYIILFAIFSVGVFVLFLGVLAMVVFEIADMTDEEFGLISRTCSESETK